MPVKFTTTNGDSGVTGTDATAKASIQPVANGEPLNQAILQRPTEHLRVRTDELKRSLEETETQHALDQGAIITTHMPSNASSKAAVTYNASVVAANRPEIPAAPGYRFNLLNDASVLTVRSSVEGSPAFKVTKQNLDGFYNTEDDHVENHPFRSRWMHNPGDTLCAVFDLSGANSRQDIVGTDGGVAVYSQSANTELNLVESYYAILPSKVCLHDDSVASLVTAYGPGAATEYFKAPESDGWSYPANAYRAGGQSGGDSLIFINIDSYGVGTHAAGNAYNWHAAGGRGGIYTSDGTATPPANTIRKDYLRVRRIKANVVEVYDTDSFRKLISKAQAAQTGGLLSWSLYDFNVSAGNAYTRIGAGSVGTNGYIKARDYSDKHVVPLCTYTGDGFSFSPNGGFIRAVPDSQTLSGGFPLPADTTSTLADSAGADSGDALVGANAKTSYGVTLPQGTVQTQLSAIFTRTLEAVSVATVTVSYQDIAAINSPSALPNANANIVTYRLTDFWQSSSVRIVSASVDLLTAFASPSGNTITVRAGTDDSGDDLSNLFSDLIVSDPALVGRYESRLNGRANGTDNGLILDSGPVALDEPVLVFEILPNSNATDNMGTLTAGLLRLTILYTAERSITQATSWI